MEEEGSWVMVRRPTETELWSPTGGMVEDGSDDLKITFNGPAKHWTDALPIGNGRLGAMVWGALQIETLNLNGAFSFPFPVFP